ncbi:phytanoyl-CoA dioxygenase family protein [Streptomyces sp. AM6-12]|uniref:phytanoyl-CoA dioxygenase family protein n=1 Tax=Streptomyces sp. AM6-12 TaxID=3345149 RepID=UPI0037A77789
MSETQLDEFTERGFVVIPQAVPGELLDRANRRVDGLVAGQPPEADKVGPHFYFLETKEEEDLLAPLTGGPAFGYAEELAGPGTLEVPWQVQVALNIPPFSHRPGIPHIDAANAEPVDDPEFGTFTMLAGVLLTDQLTEDSGNLWVWPGTHRTHAAYFREHGTGKYCAYPPITLPEPEQITGRAGDLLLAHYLLGHNIGGNFASDQTRRVLYYRISSPAHATRQKDFLQDVWLEYGPIRSRLIET